MNRKASAEATIIYLALFFVFTILMLSVIKASRQESETLITRESCGKSVERMDAFNRFGIPTSDTGLNCPVVVIKINNNDNEKNKEKIADGMYNCAKQFKRGEVELFSHDGVYCNVCYTFDIQVKEPITGFQKYIFEERIEHEPDKPTYYEYLQGFRSEGATKILGELDETVFVNDIETGKQKQVNFEDFLNAAKLEPESQHAIIFIYARGQDNIEKIYKHLTAQTTAGKAGLAAGGVSFGAFATSGATRAATSVAIGLIRGSIVVTPYGWVALGAGLTVGAAAYGAAEYTTYFVSPDRHPEYASFFVFRKWDRETSPNELAYDIGCQYLG